MALVVIAACVLGGCTAHHALTSVQEAPAQADPLAAQLGVLPYGTHAGVATPYGPNATVRIGENYYSGLGLTCRRVIMDTATGSHRAAVCKQGDTWFLADPIFEPTVR